MHSAAKMMGFYQQTSRLGALVEALAHWTVAPRGWVFSLPL